MAQSFSEQAGYNVCRAGKSNCQSYMLRNLAEAKQSIVYPSHWHQSAAMTQAIMAAKKRGVHTEMISGDTQDRLARRAPSGIHAETISIIDNKKVLFTYPHERTSNRRHRYSVYTINDPGFAHEMMQHVLGHSRMKTLKKRMSNTCRLIIPQRHNGNYEVFGEINGREVNFLVDTGATYVTVPGYMAKELNLKPKIQSKAQTATHRIIAHITWIKELRVGPIVLKNVKAALLPNSNNRKVLLGMSAIRQLDMLQHQDNLVFIQYQKRAQAQPCVVDAGRMTH